MFSGYINEATGHLVKDLKAIITRRDDLNSNIGVNENFTNFYETCKMRPAIVDYISMEIEKAGNCRAFSAAQVQLLMLATISRSSSTYGTIPGVVSHLALVGEHADASILNENAKNETGDRSHIPHSILLYECFSVIAEALSVPALTPARYHIMRLILLERSGGDAEALGSIDAVKECFQQKEFHVPRHNEDDIAIAIHYANQYGSALTDLHSAVIETESRFTERGVTSVSRNPYDKAWLAVRCLELAMREASSVDEHETNRLSYIGAWGQVVEYLAPSLSQDALTRARAWTEVHNDEAAGQAAGWGGAAEQGHAEDARGQAVKMMETLRPQTFATVLGEVTRLNLLRLQFWDRAVDALKHLAATAEPTAEFAAAE
jgi:hypothetical protein